MDSAEVEDAEKDDCVDAVADTGAKIGAERDGAEIADAEIGNAEVSAERDVAEEAITNIL